MPDEAIIYARLAAIEYVVTELASFVILSASREPQAAAQHMIEQGRTDFQVAVQRCLSGSTLPPESLGEIEEAFDVALGGLLGRIKAGVDKGVALAGADAPANNN